ncbi:helix-turn-helix transcriptional regulator [Wenjunlia tyrosinilytica]|uniref:DNA-binding protein n=1 Tax=Wenjunlia tyrosinilytica TaxID=1544741 RepID=A0A918DYW7_9ACTN|nr:helix-turn-helix transcriptional regulator [Wenjunlia tyrosinilytica]GGO89633.1 DNA-binding protein [Wenjunlia tyrosinilytica]
MDRRAELGDFLRSRRARLKPEDVGLTAYGNRRRVPGLRREELAQLAGVSVDYYIRLEQGRGQNVSEEVLDAVGRALALDADEHEHLRHLARPARGKRRPAPRPQRVRPTLEHLLAAMEGVPAFVLGRRMDVLAWNRMAVAVLGVDFAELPREQRNMVRHAFLDGAAADFYVDWEKAARDTVACLRMEAGRYPDDPQLAALVGELSVKSEHFSRLWAGQEVREKTHGSKRMNHPVVGELTLQFETFRLADDPDQALCTYTAEPGSPSETALKLLATLACEPSRAWYADERAHEHR